MNIGLNHFIVLILKLHVLWYDTLQENYYFIEMELIGEWKKNQNVVEVEDWTYAHWEPACFRS